MLQTDGVRAVLLDPLGYFDTMPEAVIHLFGLWAARLEPEMNEVDFVTSYFALLADLQEGFIRSPLARRDPEAYRSFFVLFPHVVPKLLDGDAERVLAVWRRLLCEFVPESKPDSV